MTRSNRRRGGQPGNQNALKHGLYRGKPAPGSRPRGAQLNNLNRLLHGQYSTLLAPSSLRVRRIRPPVRPPILPSVAHPDLEQKTPAPPSAAFAAVFSLVEHQLFDLLDDPFLPPSEMTLRLRQLNDLLYQLQDSRQATLPTNPHASERTPTK
jgi:hypothetical protein